MFCREICPVFVRRREFIRRITCAFFYYLFYAYLIPVSSDSKCHTGIVVCGHTCQHNKKRDETAGGPKKRKKKSDQCNVGGRQKKAKAFFPRVLCRQSPPTYRLFLRVIDSKTAPNGRHGIQIWTVHAPNRKPSPNSLENPVTE